MRRYGKINKYRYDKNEIRVSKWKMSFYQKNLSQGD